MSDEHSPDHPHAHGPAATPPITPDDAGSRALAEALRSSFAIVKFVMGVLVVVFFVSGLFQVGTQEKAVILRFGKPVEYAQGPLLGPGLHWSYPYPIDEVVKIPITEIQKVTSNIGWYALTPEEELMGRVPQAGPSLAPGRDGYVITADQNILHSRATLFYRVDDPIRYVFDLVSASNTVQNALNNALLYTAAHFNVDDVLYGDVAGFQEAVQQRVTTLVEQERLGISIDHCYVKSDPPRQLQEVFDLVTKARQSQSQLINAAHTYENGRTNNADAMAASIIYEARSARALYVQSVQADATNFSILLTNYEINPSLFNQQQLVQVMGRVLTNANFKAFLPTTANGEPTELRLLLNREPPSGPNQGAP